jgi:hypothetical protein
MRRPISSFSRQRRSRLKALAELVSNGILGTKLKVTRIPRPARFGIGDDLIVRETAQGLCGVAEGEDYFESQFSRRIPNARQTILWLTGACAVTT